MPQIRKWPRSRPLPLSRLSLTLMRLPSRRARLSWPLQSMVLYDILRLTGPPSTPIQRLVVHGKEDITQVLINFCARYIPLLVPYLLNRPNHVRLECGKLEVNCITVSGWTTFSCMWYLSPSRASYVFFNFCRGIHDPLSLQEIPWTVI